MELGHLLISSGLTHLDVSSVVSPGSFCLLFCSPLLFTVICYEAFCLHVVSSFFCSPLFHPNLGLYLNPLQSLHFLNNLSKCIQLFFSVVILLASLTLTAQFSIPYNKAGRASVLYNFIIAFFKVFCGLNKLLITPVIFKAIFNLVSMSTSFS